MGSACRAVIGSVHKIPGNILEVGGLLNKKYESVIEFAAFILTFYHTEYTLTMIVI